MFGMSLETVKPMLEGMMKKNGIAAICVIWNEETQSVEIKQYNKKISVLDAEKWESIKRTLKNG